MYLSDLRFRTSLRLASQPPNLAWQAASALDKVRRCGCVSSPNLIYQGDISVLLLESPRIAPHDFFLPSRLQGLLANQDKYHPGVVQ